MSRLPFASGYPPRPGSHRPLGLEDADHEAVGRRRVHGPTSPTSTCWSSGTIRAARHGAVVETVGAVAARAPASDLDEQGHTPADLCGFVIPWMHSSFDPDDVVAWKRTIGLVVERANGAPRPKRADHHDCKPGFDPGDPAPHGLRSACLAARRSGGHRRVSAEGTRDGRSVGDCPSEV
jgi:hypothetical protein